MRALVIRNLKIFFRDKMNVFFSMLVILITFGLYVLFLGSNLARSFPDIEGIGSLLDNWIMAGILATVSLSTTLGAFGIMVNDRNTKKEKDFLSAPITHGQRVAGYTLSTCVIGILMSLFTLLVAQLYIISNGGRVPSVIEILALLGVIVLSVLSSTGMMYLIVQLFHSPMAFETAASILNTVVGFLAGVYIPLGVLPKALQYASMLFPVSHSASLFRQIMMTPGIEAAMEGAPAESRRSFEVLLGVRYELNGDLLEPWLSVAYLALTAILFYAVGILLASRKRK